MHIPSKIKLECKIQHAVITRANTSNIIQKSQLFLEKVGG